MTVELHTHTHTERERERDNSLTTYGSVDDAAEEEGSGEGEGGSVEHAIHKPLFASPLDNC